MPRSYRGVGEEKGGVDRNSRHRIITGLVWLNVAPPDRAFIKQTRDCQYVTVFGQWSVKMTEVASPPVLVLLMSFLNWATILWLGKPTELTPCKPSDAWSAFSNLISFNLVLTMTAVLTRMNGVYRQLCTDNVFFLQWCKTEEHMSQG